MQKVLVGQDKDAFVIRLNRPEKRNAFDPEMIKEITLAFRAASQSMCRFVLLSGEGESFCAGGDLSWMKSMKNFTQQENLEDARRLNDMFLAASECLLPVVTKVQGHAMGGGLGLVAVSDIVVAEVDTLFSFSEVKIGLAPAVIMPYVLRKMSFALAREKMLTGEIFSAKEAKRLGAVQYVGRELEIEEQLDKIRSTLYKAGPEALRATKALLNKISGHYLQPSIHAHSEQVISERRTSAEGQEGLAAFLEKRTPNWSRKF